MYQKCNGWICINCNELYVYKFMMNDESKMINTFWCSKNTSFKVKQFYFSFIFPMLPGKRDKFFIWKCYSIILFNFVICKYLFRYKEMSLKHDFSKTFMVSFFVIYFIVIMRKNIHNLGRFGILCNFIVYQYKYLKEKFPNKGEVFPVKIFLMLII